MKAHALAGFTGTALGYQLLTFKCSSLAVSVPDEYLLFPTESEVIYPDHNLAHGSQGRGGRGGRDGRQGGN